MITVRVLSRTAVIVGHRQLLPDEIHQVAGGDLNVAVALYGAAAFRILDGAPVVADTEVEATEDTEVEATEDTDTEPEMIDAAPASQRNRRKG